MVREPDHREIGIAIGECRQPIAALECLERRNHICERLELVARGVPEREGLVRHLALVANGFGRAARWSRAADRKGRAPAVAAP